LPDLELSAGGIDPGRERELRRRSQHSQKEADHHHDAIDACAVHRLPSSLCSETEEMIISKPALKLLQWRRRVTTSRPTRSSRNLPPRVPVSALGFLCTIVPLSLCTSPDMGKSPGGRLHSRAYV